MAASVTGHACGPARGGAGDRSASRATAGEDRATRRPGRGGWRILAWLAALLLPAVALGQSTQSGTLVRNVAQVEYRAEGAPRLMLSNEVTLRTEPAVSRGRVALARYASSPAEVALRATAGPTRCLSEAGIVTLTEATAAGVGRIDPASAVPLAETATVHAGDAVFVRVDDADQNRDGSVRETVEVRLTSRDTGDSELLRLAETAPDSGVFAGFVPSRTGAGLPSSCQLDLARDSSLEVSYVDPRDAGDVASASGLVDPFGVVFDSTTGEPVDGVRVRLLTASGAAATVFGDDGVSRYPSEMITGEPVTDAGGTTYRLPRGVYRFPLVTSGDYRLVVEPRDGHVFPSGAPPEDLQRLPGAPFRIGEGSFGRAFQVAAPVISALDVPLDPQGSALVLQKSASAEVAAIGDFVAYDLVVRNGGARAAIRDVEIIDQLPRGVRYRAGTARIDGRTGAEPRVEAAGGRLVFGLPRLAPGQAVRIRYLTELTVGVRGEELVNTAIATASGGVVSNEAQASIRVRDELFTERGFVVGRVIQARCDADPRTAPGVEGVAIYLEDGRYAVTDREGRYHFEDVPPGTHVVQADVGRADAVLELLDCQRDARRAGRSYSQFVELRPGGLWRADFRVASGSGQRTADVAGGGAPAGAAAGAGPAAAGSPAPPDVPARAATGSAADGPATPPWPDVEELPPGIRFLAPDEDATPAIASLRVALAHAPGQQVSLAINGESVSPLNFDGTQASRSGNVALSRWRGVDLRDGPNELVAEVRDATGVLVQRLARRVHYGGGPVRAEFDRAASTLLADGRTRPVVVLRLYDAWGRPARPGTLGSFQVGAPYRSWWEVQALDDNPLLATGAREPTFEVGQRGLARLELEPTTLAGTATLRLRFNERQTQEVRAWLEPAARDWIMVGIAAGTAAWNRLGGSAEPLGEGGAPLEEGFTDGGRVAFFAKGRVRGDALLTLAYDSARDRREARRRLQNVIAPDEYYLLYADGTESRAEAASTEKLFVKLERRQFVAMFGDFETGFTVTELARYDRSLTGFKADYVGETVGASAFAARTDLGYGRDELRGDGTSGLYRLSRTPIVTGSDRLRIEVRDRFRTEQVVSSRELARFLDYRLDYATGELFFKEPVPSRDEAFNPVFIVAEYETASRGEEVTTAGGRAFVRSADARAEAGVTLVEDGAVSGDTQLAGADLRWQLAPATELRAEVARSRSRDPARAAQASAYLAEMRHVSERLEALLYLREQQAGFGVGQQLSTEAGTRKSGIDLRWNVDAHWALEAELLAQTALETGADRQLAAAQLRHERETLGAGVGLRQVADRVPGQGNNRSEQAFLTGNVDLFDRRITLRGSADATLAGRDDSVDYPARTLLGIDWHVRDDVDLFTEWEHADGEALRSDMTRVGVRARPWERTQVLSSLNQQATEFGPRSFANFGLTQGFRLNARWTFDVGVDQSNTLRGPGVAPLLSPQVPLASGASGLGGSEDFLATFVGTQYHDDAWTLTGRAERRTADSGRRWSLTAGWYREQSSGHSLSMSLQHLDTAPRLEGPDETSTGLRFAWAWRPGDASWIVFNRLDLERERRQQALAVQETQRWVDNLHANWQLRPNLQAGVQLGLRRVVGSFDEQRLRGTTLLLAGDWRIDLPWRPFGRAIDAGLHAARIESREAGVGRNSIGIDVGVSPATNVWVSVGYNAVGFRDADFSAARYTARGPYLSFRIKADQDTFKDLRLDSLRAPR
ncbi:MAG: hypothetical protein MUF07_11495 [Steroidobacteraceae bacterium]|nr:hypothetical protein [Steroidobacteraceae bacterium]